VFSGTPLAFRGAAADTEAPDWRSIAREQITAVIFLEYVLNTYTFDLWVELVLVPILTTIALLDVFARTRDEYKSVAKVTGTLQFIIVILILYGAVRRVIADFAQIHPSGALRDILLAPMLSLWLLPLAYVLYLMSAYEQLFVKLKVAQPRDPKVIRYAKRKLLATFGLRAGAVRVFNRNHGFELISANTKEDVNRLIASIGQ